MLKLFLIESADRQCTPPLFGTFRHLRAHEAVPRSVLNAKLFIERFSEKIFWHSLSLKVNFIIKQIPFDRQQIQANSPVCTVLAIQCMVYRLEPTMCPTSVGWRPIAEAAFESSICLSHTSPAHKPLLLINWKCFAWNWIIIQLIIVNCAKKLCF